MIQLNKFLKRIGQENLIHKSHINGFDDPVEYVSMVLGRNLTIKEIEYIREIQNLYSNKKHNQYIYV